MLERFKTLQKRIAILERRAGVPTDVVQNLPRGVEFIWDSLDAIEAEVAFMRETFSRRRVLEYVEELREDIRDQASSIRTVRLDVNMKYLRETNYALSRLLRNIRVLGDEGNKVSKLEDLLAKMMKVVPS